MLKLNRKLLRSDILVKIRLSVYVLTLCHLIILAIYLLGHDYSKSKDPQLKPYVKIKWKLLTAWFNILLGPYLISSIICDWYHWKQRDFPRYIKVMNKWRHFIFTSIIGPVTLFGDILFWRLYNKDKSLLMPLSAEEYVSIWNHHSMHTVTLVFVLFELVCVPRRRPKHMMPGIIAMASFLNIYTCVCIHSALNGEYVYPFLKTLTIPKMIIGFIYVHIANLFYYTGQWVIVDIIWGQKEEKIKIA